MSISLFDTAPDFNQPIAVLKHCHDKIRKQLATLEKMPSHCATHGADANAQQGAAAVLRYFDNAAKLHHQDEEQDLFPMLDATAHGVDQAALQALVPELLTEHRHMEILWEPLHAALSAIANGTANSLPATSLHEFTAMYYAHMDKEENTIAPMAKRLFDAAQMAQLGLAMQQRRGIAHGVGSSHVDR